MTVYVVQVPHQRGSSGNLEPKFDLSGAKKYGKIVELLSPTASPFHPAYILKELQEKLHFFNDKDYLLLIGNPALIGFSVAVAAEVNNGNIKLLQWRNQGYTEIVAQDVFGFNEDFK